MNAGNGLGIEWYNLAFAIRYARWYWSDEGKADRKQKGLIINVLIKRGCIR